MTEIILTSSILILLLAVLRRVLGGRIDPGCSTPCGCWRRRGC